MHRDTETRHGPLAPGPPINREYIHIFVYVDMLSKIARMIKIGQLFCF